ncbi:capsule biosynthesis GfcC family protein [Escherichia coli]|nr:capsule biosynthesis GfcC family protein [Escherichia coli]
MGRDFTLYTGQGPVTFTLLGAVSGAGQLPWQAGRSVPAFLQDHPPLEGGAKKNVRGLTPGVGLWSPPCPWGNKTVVDTPLHRRLWGLFCP